MKLNRKYAFSFAVLRCLAAAMWAVVSNMPHETKATYSQFLQQVETGAVASAVVLAANSGANQITCILKNGDRLRATVPADYAQALSLMQDKMVNIETRDASLPWFALLTKSSPFLILVVVWIVMLGRLKQWPKNNLIA